MQSYAGSHIHIPLNMKKAILRMVIFVVSSCDGNGYVLMLCIGSAFYGCPKTPPRSWLHVVAVSHTHLFGRQRSEGSKSCGGALCIFKQ